MGETKKRIVHSKCLADALIWLGFEYTKEGDDFVFERSYAFDSTWKDLHALRADAKRRLESSYFNKPLEK